jgi:endonuclease YncB( thermonuclease family)
VRRTTWLLALTLTACGGAFPAPGTSAPATTTPVTTSPVTTTPVTTSPVTTNPIGSPPDGVGAIVDVVRDGDSIAVIVDGRSDEVRIVGINAPGSDECFGDEARALLTAMAGDEVVLVEQGRDQYGRILATTYSGADDLGLAMIEAGGALAESVDHPLLARYLAAEQTAFSSRVGMWAPDACGPATGAVVRIEQVVADPPGRDETNLDGESVTITADAPTDLGGWVLRDESTVHRYTFPAGFVLQGSVSVLVGCGDDSPTVLHWCADGPVWNNDGDTALLQDTHGDVVARFRYP